MFFAKFIKQRRGLVALLSNCLQFHFNPCSSNVLCFSAGWGAKSLTVPAKAMACTQKRSMTPRSHAPIESLALIAIMKQFSYFYQPSCLAVHQWHATSTFTNDVSTMLTKVPVKDHGNDEIGGYCCGCKPWLLLPGFCLAASHGICPLFIQPCFHVAVVSTTTCASA